MKKQINISLVEAWDLGVSHSRTELNSAKKRTFKINMGRIAEDAAEFLRVNSFRMFGFLNDDMKQIVQGVLVNGVKFSWTTDEIITKMYDSLNRAGFLDVASNAVATGRSVTEISEAIETSLGGAHRVKTAIRTNIFEAINEARYSAFTDPALDGFVEALEYSAILDSRTTNICRHLDDRVYPVDAPEWDSYRPPNHFNCRSILVPVTIVDDDVTGKDRESDSRWSKGPKLEPQQGFGSETG